MKVKVFIDDKEQFIDANKIIVNGVTLENLAKKLVRLEVEFSLYKKQQDLKTEKLKGTWNKMRGSSNE